MRRSAVVLGLVAFLVAMAGLSAGSASAAGSKKLVEGTVYDTTCASSCVPECPPIPCGPVTQAAGPNICAQQRMIVCPLHRTVVCVQTSPCGGAVTYPPYSGEGAVVKVRRRGSTKVLATLPVVEGHFKIRLAPGRYELGPFLPEPQCWSGERQEVQVTAKAHSPISASLYVENSCVAHPDATN